ncbi:hypothetical protein [Streptomyces sp. NPDC001530]|uniref:hypothetical protein n=1 Tax=Streptomyces sp. NPDC001530 TaxID=3364582 RepID=UPI00368B9786
MANPAMPPCANAHPADQLREPSDLAVAISVGQRMLAAYDGVGIGDIDGLARAHGALTESLRILLRALDAEPVAPSVPANERREQEAVRRSVDAQFPAVAAFLAAERGEQQ